MSVGYPLSNVGTQHRKDTEINANQTTASHQPEVAEGILNPFHDAGKLFLLAAGDTCAPNRQIDDFRDGEHTDDYGNNIQAVPQIERSESISQGSGLGIDADGCEHQTDTTGQ